VKWFVAVFIDNPSENNNKFSAGLLHDVLYRRVHKHPYQSDVQQVSLLYLVLSSIFDGCAKAVYLGIKGIANTKRNGEDKVILLSYVLLAFVGVGSAAYHTNIKYWAQISTSIPFPAIRCVLILGFVIVDETSMLYATFAILFAAFSITLGRNSRLVLGTVLSCFALCASITNGYLDDEDSFQSLFAVMVVAVFFQCGWLVWRRVSHPHVAREMLWLGSYGTSA
jgi:dihydroceramidase